MKRELRLDTTDLLVFGSVAGDSSEVDSVNVNSGILGALGAAADTVTVKHADVTGGPYVTAQDRYGDDLIFTLTSANSEAFDLKVASLKQFVIFTTSAAVNLAVALGDKDYMPDNDEKTMA